MFSGSKMHNVNESEAVQAANMEGNIVVVFAMLICGAIGAFLYFLVKVCGVQQILALCCISDFRICTRSLSDK